MNLALLNCAETDIVPTILVIAACGAPHAIAGGMCANVAKLQGFAGIVTDGPLPFFAKGKCAKSGNKQQIGSTKKAIECGDVKVNLGDIIFADSDGVVALSKSEAISAILKGEKMLQKETDALQKIRDGARFNQIFLLNSE